MFQDEARFGRISDTRYCWAPYPLRPMVKAMLTCQYTYAYGAVSPVDGRFDSLVQAGTRAKLSLCRTSCGCTFCRHIHLNAGLQEHIWDELREKYFHNKAFDSMDALEVQLLAGLRHLEGSTEVVRSIAGWE